MRINLSDALLIFVFFPSAFFLLCSGFLFMIMNSLGTLEYFAHVLDMLLVCVLCFLAYTYLNFGRKHEKHV